MAKCYSCWETFYGNECPYCGWVATYKCFNCKTKICPKYDDELIKCKACGWFQCPSCETCGCGNAWEGERPFSKQEKEEMQW